MVELARVYNVQAWLRTIITNLGATKMWGHQNYLSSWSSLIGKVIVMRSTSMLRNTHIPRRVQTSTEIGIKNAITMSLTWINIIRSEFSWVLSGFFGTGSIPYNHWWITAVVGCSYKFLIYHILIRIPISATSIALVLWWGFPQLSHEIHRFGTRHITVPFLCP